MYEISGTVHPSSDSHDECGDNETGFVCVAEGHGHPDGHSDSEPDGDRARILTCTPRD